MEKKNDSSYKTLKTFTMLYVSNISSTTDEIDRSGKSYLAYVIITVGSGNLQTDRSSGAKKQWITKRRFREFYDNYKLLSKLYPSIKSFEFPQKNSVSLISSSIIPANPNKRLEKLQQYLRLINDLHPMPIEVKEFLNIIDELNNDPIIADHDSSTPISIETNRKLIQNETQKSSIKEIPSSNSVSVGTVEGKIQTTGEVDKSIESVSSKWSIKATTFTPQLTDSSKTTKGTETIPVDQIHDMVCSALFISGICTVALTLASIKGISWLVWQVWHHQVRFVTWTELIHILQIWTKTQLQMNRRIGQALILFVTILMTLHRVLGYLAGLYLRRILGYSSHNEKYNFHFKWVSCRFGLDKNEILISDFEWKNPQRYQHTPCLVRIKEISVAFNAASIVRAYLAKPSYSLPIVIDQLLFDSVDVFIEKSNEKGAEGLNLWAAMGAESKDEEKSLQNTIRRGLGSVMDSTLTGTQEFGKAVIKYNPASLLLRGARSATSSMGGFASPTLTPTTTGSGFTLPNSGMFFGGGGGVRNKSPVGSVDANGPSTVSQIETVSLLADDSTVEDNASVGSDFLSVISEEKDGVVTNEEYGADSVEASPANPLKTSIGIAGLEEKETAAAKGKGAGTKRGFGFPYPIYTKRLVLHNLNLNAQDFLNASHSDVSRLSAIIVEVMTMTDRDLTKKPRQSGESRRAIYLDDIVWRIINRLIAELFRSNKIAMLTIFASAAANQTTTAISSAVSNVADVATSAVSNTMATTNAVMKGTIGAVGGNAMALGRAATSGMISMASVVNTKQIESTSESVIIQSHES